MRLSINEPFWKHNGLGINLKAFEGRDEIEVECLYKNTKGYYQYPHVYKVSLETAKNAKKHHLRGVSLAVVPFYEMGVVEYRKPNRDEILEEAEK